MPFVKPFHIKLFAVSFALLLFFAMQAIKVNAADLYIQGSMGYGFASFEEKIKNTNIDEEADGHIRNLGMEFGIANIGQEQNIRAGIAYNNLAPSSEEDKGVDTGLMSNLSINGYYFLSNPNVMDGAFKPYVGLGVSLEPFFDGDYETLYYLHAGLEKRYNEDISFGFRYSYLMAEDDSRDFIETEGNAHLFSANFTHHIRGGL